MGVTGQFLLPKNDFEHAHGPRNSAYTFWTRQTYRHTSREISIEHPVWGSLRSPKYITERNKRKQNVILRHHFLPIAGSLQNFVKKQLP